MPVKSIDKKPKKVYASKKHRQKNQRKSMLVKSIDGNTKEKSSDKFQSWKSGEILKISQYHFYILKSISDTDKIPKIKYYIIWYKKDIP